MKKIVMAGVGLALMGALLTACSDEECDDASGTTGIELVAVADSVQAKPTKPRKSKSRKKYSSDDCD